MLKVGDKAPDFTLNDKDGNKVSLKDFKGKKLVLYFYPKDNTSGCTKEACDFRDNLKSFSKLNAEVIGISADSEKTHTSFTEKYNLNFRLLSDPDKDAIQKYDVWKEKSMYGKKYMGIERTTYLIDEKGKIKKIFNKVKVDDHISEVLNEMEK